MRDEEEAISLKKFLLYVIATSALFVVVFAIGLLIVSMLTSTPLDYTVGYFILDISRYL
jgi:hypothetical protein